MKKEASYDIEEVMRENEQKELVYVPNNKKPKADIANGFVYSMSPTKQLKDEDE